MARAPFPQTRLRRLRRTEALRRLTRETELAPRQLVYPLFCTPGKGLKQPIGSMPGVSRLSPDLCAEVAREVQGLGIGAVLLFGIPAQKDATGTSGIDPNGIVPETVRAIKAAAPELCVVTDVCLCEYTDHGHCGVLADKTVDNDETLPLLALQALAHAAAGADIVAPSDMMDGRVAAIRRALDEGGYEQTPILSYAAKFASAFYGPFREAAGSAPREGDRRGYQMDPSNGREALEEIAVDIAEGADLVMVKPALAYLDVLKTARERFGLPLWAYNVSGEYAMLKAAAAAGYLDEERAMMEMLTGIRRAGADAIVTYFALDAARVLSR
jgi:porphobilinogen synthase